jgi:hypothetical protein
VTRASTSRVPTHLSVASRPTALAPLRPRPESIGGIGLVFIGLGLWFILPQSPRMQAAWQTGSGSGVVALHVSSDRPELGLPA